MGLENYVKNIKSLPSGVRLEILTADKSKRKSIRTTSIANYFFLDTTELYEGSWLKVAGWDYWRRNTELLKKDELTTVQASILASRKHPAICGAKEWEKIKPLWDKMESAVDMVNGVPTLCNVPGRIVSKYANFCSESVTNTEPVHAFSLDAYRRFFKNWDGADSKADDFKNLTTFLFGDRYFSGALLEHGFTKETAKERWNRDDFGIPPYYLDSKKAKEQEDLDREQGAEIENQKKIAQYGDIHVCDDLTIADICECLNPKDGEDSRERLKIAIKTALALSRGKIYRKNRNLYGWEKGRAVKRGKLRELAIKIAKADGQTVDERLIDGVFIILDTARHK